MIPLRRALLSAAVVVMLTATFGAAATLGVEGLGVAAGSDVVTRCDTGGIAVDYVGDPGPVGGITVSGLSSTCDGGTLSATVTKADGSSPVTGPSTVVVGGTATVTFSAPVAAEDVGRYRVAVVTP